MRLERGVAAVPADRRVAGMADADQRLRLARGQLAGIVAAARIRDTPAELGEMAARAAGLAGGGKLRREEQIAAELDQRLVFDRTRGWAAVLALHRRDLSRRRALRPKRGSGDDRSKRHCHGKDA